MASKADAIRKLIAKGETDPKAIARRTKANISQVYSLLKAANNTPDRSKAKPQAPPETITDNDEIIIENLRFWAKTAQKQWLQALQKIQGLERDGVTAKAYWLPKGKIMVVSSTGRRILCSGASSA